MTRAAGKREQNKEGNRAALIEAARRCFVELGYDAVTVRDIVRGTELASGTFYNYFPDKEALFRELLKDSIDDINGRMHEIRKRARSIPDFVRGTYAVLFHKVRDDPEFFALILRSEHAARALFKDTVLGLPIRSVKSDIRDAVKRGLFPEVDADLLAASFYGIGFEIGRLLPEGLRGYRQG